MINFRIFNPFKTWWKVRKLFKFKYKFHIGKYFWYYGDRILENKIALRFVSLGFKYKYEEPRFEYAPRIYFKFFNWEIRLMIGPDDKENYFYWETILDYLDNNNLRKSVKNNTWISKDKKINVVRNNLLTKKGLKLYYGY